MNKHLIILLGAAIIFGIPIGVGLGVARLDVTAGVVAGVVTFVAIIALAQSRISREAGRVIGTMLNKGRHDGTGSDDETDG